MTKSIKRRPWTIEEDDAIRQLVEEHGTKQWSVVSEKLSTEFTLAERSGK
jgi:hypothetical protein